MRVTVSSCLLGIDCRYCGDGYPQEGILKLIGSLSTGVGEEILYL